MPAPQVRFENVRVRVSEVVFAPGVARESYLRATDQIVVFLDDCRVDRLDASTGGRLTRDRRAGEVVFHNAGEHEPALINTGSPPFRTVLIEIKE